LYINIAIDNTAKGIKMLNPWLNKIGIREELYYKKERERKNLRKGREEKCHDKEEEREREGIVFCLILVQETHIHGWFVQQF